MEVRTASNAMQLIQATFYATIRPAWSYGCRAELQQHLGAAAYSWDRGRIVNS